MKQFNQNIFSLQGRVALVTGGASGIGKCITEFFIRNGARVAVIDLLESDSDGDKTSLLNIKADVTSSKEAEQVINQTVEHFGKIDIVVNSAGIVILQPAEQLTEDAWDKTLAVNLKGVFLISQQAGRKFIAQGHGKIINLASQAGIVAIENHLAYCASKSAIIGLTQVLALEWGKYNIQVNAISPTVVMTELGKKAWSGDIAEHMKNKIPLRRFAEPEDIAAAALYLASDASSMVTGANLVIDGGYTIC